MTSVPPVLDPVAAAALRDLSALQQYQRAKQITVPTTTLSCDSCESVIIGQPFDHPDPEIPGPLCCECWGQVRR